MRIEDLEKIQAVEAPAFLFTRIEQKIAGLNTGIWPRKIRWALQIVLVLVLLLNVTVLLIRSNHTQNIKSYATALNLNPDNELYK